MNERRGSPPTTWIALIGSVLVVLAVMANVLLWQILDDQGSDGSRDAGAVSQPALPAPMSGTSNRAASSEIDRLTRGLNRRFRRLEPDLSKLAGAAGRLPQAFGSIAGPLATFTTSIGDSAAQTNAQLTTSNLGIAQTNTQLTDMLARLAQMNRRFGGLGDSIAGVARTTDGVVDNTAGIETTISGLRGDVQQLNSNLVGLLNAICSDPQAPPGCP